MQSDRSQIEEIKSKIDIVSLIGETVQLTHESGDTYKGAVDSSSQSGKSLNVDRGTQLWKDWANEGDKGDVFNWIASKNSLDIQSDFPQILSIAAKYAGVELTHTKSTHDPDLLTFNTAVSVYYHGNLTDGMRAYILEKWGISDATIDELNIGFAPIEDSLISEFGDVFSTDVIKKSGLMIDTGYQTKDFYSGRIMFPYWKHDNVVYFIGRKCKYTPGTKYEQAKYKKQMVHSDKKKYVSESVNNSYFYGENSLKGAKHCLITEGVTDCIMAVQNDIPCISPVTVRFRKEDYDKMYALVKRLDTVYICNDSEDNESGMKGAVDTAKFLESKNVDVRLVRLPRGDGVEKVDVADFLRDATKHDFEQLMQNESFYVWDLLLDEANVPRSTTARIRACKVFLESDLSGMNDDTFSAFALNDVAPKFGLGKRDVGRLLKSVKRVDEVEQSDEDFYFFDEFGKLLVKKLSEYVMSIISVATMTDNKNIYCYHDGVYRNDGEDTIIKILQNVLGDATKKHHVAEILQYVRYSTLTKRDDMTTEITKINLLNGVYNIATGELEPHSPEVVYITQIPVNYDKNATCPAFDKFVGEIAHDYDIPNIYEFIGYCLIPDTTIETAMMLIGEGANGKSKLLDAIRLFIGHENSSGESLHDLENDPYSKAELFGKLVNIFPDLASGMIYENTAFKMITGDEGAIRASRKYEHPFTFKNTARLIFSANKLPPVPADNFAYYRRWLLLEFPNKFEGENRDRNILAKITTKEEQSGLLNKAISALKTLLENGEYSNTKPVEEIEKMYKINSDPISAFADETIVYSVDDCLKELIYQSYIKWCDEHGTNVKSGPQFAKRFRKLGYTERRDSTKERKYYWENCNIVQSVRVTKIYSDGENRHPSPHPSECPIKKPYCNVMGNNILENEGENVLKKLHNMKQWAKSSFTRTDGEPDSGLTRPSTFRDSDGLRTDSNKITKPRKGDKSPLQLLRNDIVNFIKSNNYIIKQEILDEFCKECPGYDKKTVSEIILEMNISNFVS